MVSAPGFDLIETLRWSREQGYYLLDRHVERLKNSASELGFSCHRSDVLACLDKATDDFTSPIERVRLLLHRDGDMTVTHTAISLPDAGDILTFSISDKTTDSKDPLYRHKTTRRELYDNERVRLQSLTGCDEALFLNERGEVTEGSIMTVFIENDGVLVTPPVSCGVLPGTLRAELLDDTARRVKEAVLTLPDLACADKVYLGNSVRGLLRARNI